ncbi:acylamino-acid-releasing enzyme-like [Gigantopelta aegis]|uniref:acylamino-acid-releasing enzyme-like n=1 Tax=Gigantopelta aegis TaxID=1735272 RepID=UPI001B887995|nr:acylamino-acid-releasing enzyme-like [Gigantopelta aegis]
MVLKKAADIVNVFRYLASFPQVTSATFSNACSNIINSCWSQRDLEQTKKTSFTRTHFLQAEKDELKVVATSSPVTIENVIWDKESPSGSLRAIVKKLKIKKDEEEKQFIEIWSKDRKLKTVDIKVLDKHGEIYENDGEFGSMEWSASEGHLVYIAEKKRPKTESFFEIKEEKEDEYKTKDEEKPVPGDKYMVHEDWGEQLVGKSVPAVCILDVDSGTVSVMENVPEDVSPGQAVWGPDDAGIVFVGLAHTPFRLGLKYCYNKRSVVYYLDIQSATCTAISEESGRAVRSPRFSHDLSKLVYLENPAGGAHGQCSRLQMYDWNTKKTETIIDFVNSASEDEFPGIFTFTLPPRCWMSDNIHVVFDTCWRSKQVVVVVNTQTKEKKQIKVGAHKGSSAVADVCDNRIIVVCSAPDQPGYLMTGEISADGSVTKWLHLDGEPTTLDGFTWKIVKHQPTADRVHKQYPKLDYDSILFLPASSDGHKESKPPLIVFPHGGPHSTHDAEFYLYSAGFTLCGYAVLMVNYRGSVGFGQDSISSLLGTIGDQDVKDVKAAAEDIQKMGCVDENKLIMFGGSHGGFLTTHLIGQYPDTFKVAACRNPVVNLTTMWGTSDILDWSMAEIGIEFSFTQLADAEVLKILWNKSPIKHVDQVKTPLMLMIGLDDQRVPNNQAREYHHALKARNKTVRFLAYEDNSHPIITVPAESDSFVNILLWFGSHIGL